MDTIKDLIRAFWLEPEVVRQVGAIATLVWIGLLLTLERLPIPNSKKIVISVATATLGLSWFVVLNILGVKCVFCAAPDSFPRIPIVLMFLFAGYFLVFRANLTQEVLRAMPPYWLLGFQFFRIIGDNFLALWAQGKLPTLFAFPIGFGDILIGLFAPLVAYWYHRRMPHAHAIAIAFNVVGLLDIAFSGTVIVFSQSSTIQLIRLTPGTDIVTQFPIVLEALYGMPLVVFVHMASLLSLLKHKQMRATDIDPHASKVHTSHLGQATS